jgi:hypothetical protein
MLKKFIEKILGKPPLEMYHEFFGKLFFMGGDNTAGDDYWEGEMTIDGCEDPIGITISANIEGPTVAQVELFKQLISDLDELFNRCWLVFKPDFEQWAGKKFSGHWRSEFQLVGLGIPKHANLNNEWHVCYFVESANHFFTAQFEGGKPSFNEIDG